MLRACPCKNVHLQHLFLQFRFTHLFKFASGQHASADPYSHLLGNCLGGDRMVTGDHLYPDAGGLALAQRLQRFAARRIDDADQSQQCQASVDMLETQFTLVGPGRFERERQDSLSAPRHLLNTFLPVGNIQRAVIPHYPLPVAHLQYAFGRAFYIDETMPGMVMVQGCHEAVFGLKRDGIRARQLLFLESRIQTAFHGQRDHRSFGRVAAQFPFVAGKRHLRIVAEETSTRQLDKFGNLIRVHVSAVQLHAAMRVVSDTCHLQQQLGGGNGLNGHLIARERAGLVRADHGNRTQCLHRRQQSDDAVAPCHALNTNGKGDGDNGGKSLGDGSDRQTHRSQKHLVQGVVPHQNPVERGT